MADEKESKIEKKGDRFNFCVTDFIINLIGEPHEARSHITRHRDLRRITVAVQNP